MRTLVGYATEDGHTGLIAQRIGKVLEDHGHTADVRDVGDLPPSFSLEDYDVVVLGAPVRKGKHLAPMLDFVREHREALQQRPSAFFSCGLVAVTQTEEARCTARGFVDTFIAETQWHPDHIGVFSGALLYRKYNFIMRAIMKHIMRKVGGTTDTSRDHDYTRWDEVEAFATEIARTVSARAAAASVETETGRTP
jgi:menaquinone-dependent protoporphyrinogen oxidase